MPLTPEQQDQINKLTGMEKAKVAGYMNSGASLEDALRSVAPSTPFSIPEPIANIGRSFVNDLTGKGAGAIARQEQIAALQPGQVSIPETTIGVNPPSPDADQGSLYADRRPAVAVGGGPKPTSKPSSGGKGTTTPAQPEIDAQGFQTVKPGGDPKQNLLKSVHNIQVASGLVQKAQAEGNAAILKEAEAKGQSATEQAEIAKNQIATLDQMEKDRQAHEIDRKQRSDNAYKQYQGAIDDYSNAKIDPENFYHNMSTGGKILTAIALGFTAGAGPSQAANYERIHGALNAAVDRDIDAQKANINKKGNVANMRQGVFKDMLAMTGDERAAESATRQVYIDNIQKQIDAKAMQFNNPIIQANAQKMIAGLNEEKAKEQMKTRELIDNKLSGYRAPSSGVSREAIAKTAIELFKDPNFKPGENVPRWAAAQREAARFHTGQDLLPGAPEASVEKAGSGASKEQEKARKAAALDTAAAGLKSISAIDNPLNPITRQFQGTDAQRDRLAQESWNSQVLSLVHQQNTAARGLEAMEAIGGAYLLKPGDSQETIARKVALAKRDLINEGPSTPAPDDLKVTPNE